MTSTGAIAREAERAKNLELTDMQEEIISCFLLRINDNPPTLKEIQEESVAHYGISDIYLGVRQLVDSGYLIETGRKWQHRRYSLSDTDTTIYISYYKKMRKKYKNQIRQLQEAITSLDQSREKDIKTAIENILISESKYWGRKTWEEKYGKKK